MHKNGSDNAEGQKGKSICRDLMKKYWLVVELKLLANP
jgi:hypothetical protein